MIGAMVVALAITATPAKDAVGLFSVQGGFTYVPGPRYFGENGVTPIFRLNVTAGVRFDTGPGIGVVAVGAFSLAIQRQYLLGPGLRIGGRHHVTIGVAPVFLEMKEHGFDLKIAGAVFAQGVFEVIEHVAVVLAPEVLFVGPYPVLQITAGVAVCL